MPFKYRKVSEEGLSKMMMITKAYEGLYDFVVANVSNGREKSLALTKLQESSMWLNKAISIDDEVKPTEEDTNESI